MSVCQIEKDRVDFLLDLISSFEPSAEDSPSERARAQRQVAALKRELARAQTALADCLKRHTSYEVRLRVVRMANTDGSNQTAVTAANVENEWVRVANLVFTPGRLRFLFDPTTDFETRNNTRLNQLVEGTGLQDDIDAITDANGIADLFPNQIVVICRTGRTILKPPDGGCGSGCGFSGYPGKYVMMPAFDPSLVPLFAHELGHYFGLPHTFRYVIDTTPDARIVFDLLGQDLSKLEGDVSVVSDTPPEMIIRDQDPGANTSIVFGGKTINFLRDNIMSYYRPLTPNGKTITQGQVGRVQTVLQERRQLGLQVTEVIS